MDTLGKRIKFARQVRGLTQQDVADHFHIKRVSVTQWEGDTSRPDHDKLPELAELLNTTTTWLLEGKGPEPEGPGTPGRRKGGKPAGVAVPQIIPGRQLIGERDLPVYSATRGGDGEMIVSTDVVEYVKRPTELEGVREGYAIRIHGDSMAKAYRDGDMALVHPYLRPQMDEVHVFYDHDPKTGDAESMIKNLLGWTADKWKLEQFNPEKKFNVDRIDWPICHRVVGKYNRR